MSFRLVVKEKRKPIETIRTMRGTSFSYAAKESAAAALTGVLDFLHDWISSKTALGRTYKVNKESEKVHPMRKSSKEKEGKTHIPLRALKSS